MFICTLVKVDIRNDAISSSKKYLEKTDQDWHKNSNKHLRSRSSKINTRPQIFDQSNVSKNTWSIYSQRIYEVNARVRDPLRCYKSYVSFQRETEQLPTPALDDK